MSAHTASSCGLSFSTQSSPPTKKKTDLQIRRELFNRNTHYKTTLCKHASQTEDCPYGLHCLFIHANNFTDWVKEKKVNTTGDYNMYKNSSIDELEFSLKARMMSRTYLPEWPPARRDKNYDQWISQCVMRQVIEEKKKKDNENALEREKIIYT
jgi:hypothetical protein